MSIYIYIYTHFLSKSFSDLEMLRMEAQGEETGSIRQYRDMDNVWKGERYRFIKAEPCTELGNVGIHWYQTHRRIKWGMRLKQNFCGRVQILGISPKFCSSFWGKTELSSSGLKHSEHRRHMEEGRHSGGLLIHEHSHFPNFTPFTQGSRQDLQSVFLKIYEYPKSA